MPYEAYTSIHQNKWSHDPLIMSTLIYNNKNLLYTSENRRILMHWLFETIVLWLHWLRITFILPL